MMASKADRWKRITTACRAAPPEGYQNVPLLLAGTMALTSVAPGATQRRDAVVGPHVAGGGRGTRPPILGYIPGIAWSGLSITASAEGSYQW